MSDQQPSEPARLLSARFVVVVAIGLCYFTALAMLTPVLPLYVEKSLGQGSVAVGIAVGAFAVGAIALRTYAGWLGDSIGRRVLIIGGAFVVSGSVACYGLVHAAWYLTLIRVVTGFGEAGFFVGAATMITDLSPPERRGEAVSYWSVAVYGGLSFGPVLGSVLCGATTRGHGGHYGRVWAVSAVLALVASALGMFTVEVEREVFPKARHLFHRAAIEPGSVLFLGLIALAGFTAFIPLYVTRVHVSSGLIFAEYGVLILVVRVLGARVPDRMGGRTTAALALILVAVGVGTIAAFPTLAGLIIGTAIFAAGMSLMYPALLLLALDGVTDSDRASVVGTFSSFFDASQGVGAFICGAVVAFAGDRGAFTTGAVCAVAGLVLLRARSWSQASAPSPA
ncbi:MAG: MFS transporter [Acidimicrobiia bacterium]